MEQIQSPEKKSPIEVVGAVIFDRKSDSILVGQRAKGKRFPLKWEFIGGKVEKGESPNQAVVRELREEVGLEIQPKGLMTKVKHDYGEEVGMIELHFIQCEPVGNVILKRFDREIYNDIRWIKITEVSGLDWIEADKDFANQLAIIVTTPAHSDN